MAPSGTNKAHPRIRVENLTREQALVTGGRAADNHWTRMRGFPGRLSLEEGEGLLIMPSQRSRFAIELPAGTLSTTNTQVGDQLHVQGYEF